MLDKVFSKYFNSAEQFCSMQLGHSLPLTLTGGNINSGCTESDLDKVSVKPKGNGLLDVGCLQKAGSSPVVKEGILNGLIAGLFQSKQETGKCSCHSGSFGENF